MAEKNNATCSICGSEYYACLSCKDKMRLAPYKMYCDTAPHYQVYQVIHGYNTSVYTKDEARIKLKNINLDDMGTFRPHIKQIIEDILKEDSVEIIHEVEPIENIEVVEETVEDVITEENVVVESVVEVERVETSETIIPRKRNYKINKVEETE